MLSRLFTLFSARVQQHKNAAVTAGYFWRDTVTADKYMHNLGLLYRASSHSLGSTRPVWRGVVWNVNLSVSEVVAKIFSTHPRSGRRYRSHQGTRVNYLSGPMWGRKKKKLKRRILFRLLCTRGLLRLMVFKRWKNNSKQTKKKKESFQSGTTIWCGNKGRCADFWDAF